jgi:nucleotide-binding universal stress UspA family protein
MKTILVTTDFSDLSHYAFQLAERIALKSGAMVHLLHVIALPSHILLTKDGELLDDCEMDTTSTRLKRSAAADRMEAIKNSSSCNIEVHTKYGHVNERVVECSKELNADLIVMASHGVNSMKEKIAGSHTEYVAMHAKSPVLSIKSDEGGHDFNSIVLAGSFQNDDIPNCDLVLELQKVFNSKIHLLRVNSSKDFLADHDAIAHMKAFASKHQIVNAEYAIYNDQDAEEGILHYAAKAAIDLIVIGSMQRTGINKFIHGCVSASLVNHANKPLLTFPLKK